MTYLNDGTLRIIDFGKLILPNLIDQYTGKQAQTQ